MSKSEIQTDKIPVHKLHEKSSSGILLEYIRDEIVTQNADASLLREVHRDNYYVFLFQEWGEIRGLIDFKEYHVQNVALGCVLPGQVHSLDVVSKWAGWAMCMDAMFIKDEWKEIFETVLISGNSIIVPDSGTQDDLRFGFTLLYRKMQSAGRSSVQHIVSALATAIAGMIAEAYRQHQFSVFNKRLTSITLQFKTLIAVHLKTVKNPAHYASILNISPAYLNEAVKKTTGFPAGYWIQSAAMLEAKRLLFYTDKSVKEVAAELGYDDYSYFTRLFTKLSGIPPTLFRANYRK
ncbi:MAG: AraC family transcriptional regulator [Bacteroidales bacterium]|jgi:AraC-like DNA-binding protein|nr:AraC family transcriptional regulator [Bacteroidales bacterium]